jgi:hypothetical protein
MANYTATIPSSWTREQTFDYLADFRSVAEWDPSMESALLLSGVAGQVGATYQLEMKVLGKTSTLVYECIELERPARFVVRSESEGMVSTDTVTVAEDASVTYDAQIDLSGVKKLADPVVDLGLHRASEKARKSLEVKLASR